MMNLSKEYTFWLGGKSIKGLLQIIPAMLKWEFSLKNPNRIPPPYECPIINKGRSSRIYLRESSKSWNNSSDVENALSPNENP